MNRTTLLSTKVLPPFEIVECPEEFIVKVKSDGDVFDIRVPIRKFTSTEEYVTYLREEIAAINDSVVMAKAAEVRKVTPEESK